MGLQQCSNESIIFPLHVWSYLDTKNLENDPSIHDMVVGSYSYLWQLLIFHVWMQSEIRINSQPIFFPSKTFISKAEFS